MNEQTEQVHLGILLHHLIALLAGIACIVAACFVFRDLEPDNIEEKWNAIHSFGVIGIAVGIYLISKILLPVRL